MHRRLFLRDLLFGSAGVLLASPLLALGRQPAPRPEPGSSPRIALTLDDPMPWASPLLSWTEANRRLLRVLAERALTTALFVCGQKVDRSAGRRLLAEWDEAGHLLGNHSFSHLMYLGRVDYPQYANDFLRNEPILAPYRHRVRLFRYPFLKEGDTAAKRDRFRALLKSRQYRVGHVTVDTSDWYVDRRLQQRRQRHPQAPIEPYRDYLVAHLLDRAAFYRQLSLEVLGREIIHTLLMHYTPLTALFLPDILQAFERQGWTWVGADRAYQDPVFDREPLTLPAGESLVWALAAESGRFQSRLRWPGEDGDYEKPRMDAAGL